jgi:hypothetical protein
MVRRRREKSKDTLIHEQAARGSGTRLGVENPIATISPRRVKPLERDGNLRNVKGRTSELVRMHRANDSDTVKREMKRLALRLAHKSYATWTAEETAEAQRLLGPEVVSVIIREQTKAKRRA